jgi:hypothetical protein
VQEQTVEEPRPRRKVCWAACEMEKEKGFANYFLWNMIDGFPIYDQEFEGDSKEVGRDKEKGTFPFYLN